MLSLGTLIREDIPTEKCFHIDGKALEMLSSHKVSSRANGPNDFSSPALISLF